MRTPSRMFVWCGACQARSAIVVGKDGQEVRDCTGCGRRQSVRAEVHRKLFAAATA